MQDKLDGIKLRIVEPAPDYPKDGSYYFRNKATDQYMVMEPDGTVRLATEEDRQAAMRALGLHTLERLSPLSPGRVAWQAYQAYTEARQRVMGLVVPNMTWDQMPQ